MPVSVADKQGARSPDHDLYRWDDPKFDRTRDVMHTPGFTQYIGCSPERETAPGLKTEFPHEVLIRHR